MDLTRYVDSLRQELAVVAAAGGAEAQALAERLTAPLESSIRLMLLDALSSAAAEITSEIAPGSVHLRLRGQEPDFVVSRPIPESSPEARHFPGYGRLARPEHGDRPGVQPLAGLRRPAGGRETVEVRARTSYGDIVVRRSKG